MNANLVTARHPVVLADYISRSKVRDVLLVVAASAFVGALAQASFKLPFTPVPITGQTLGVLLAGCALGWRRAGAALSLYLLAGSIGLPWFEGHTSGWQGASTGYLFGFILAAVVCGSLAERGADRTIVGSIPTMLIGEVCIYAIGVPWLAVDLHVSLGKAIALGFTPFVVVDAIKLAIAAGVLPSAWRLARSSS